MMRNKALRLGGRAHSFLIFAPCLVLLLLSCLAGGCAGPPPKKAQIEAAPAPMPPVVDQPQEQPRLTPPTPGEVRDAVRRVFYDRAVLDPDHKPNFLDGDFNGDNSQDIVVVLKPVPERIADLNQEAPPWILRDLLLQPRPDMPTPRISETESLLAVIHGYGREGWRDPQATQTYLLKNAVGARMKAQKQKEFLAANRNKKTPRLYGDLIGELRAGSSGYLYYNQATYVWYDPKNFKGEPGKRLVHGGAFQQVK